MWLSLFPSAPHPGGTYSSLSLQDANWICHLTPLSNQNGYLRLGPSLTSPTRDGLVSFLPLFPSWTSPSFFNFYFRYMGVWLACLFVYYLQARCHWIPKGGVCSLELELPVGCESPCRCCGIEPGPSGRVASDSEPLSHLSSPC